MTAPKATGSWQVFDTVIDQPVSPVLADKADADRYVQTSPHGPKATEVREVAEVDDAEVDADD